MSEDKLVKRILQESKVIAVVGLSPKPHRTSHMVSGYLQAEGYKIIPVYPREDKILGEKVYRKVSEIRKKIDLVLIFRRSEEVFEVVQDVVKADPLPKYIWMQKGITCSESEKTAKEHNVGVIMDRCIKVEHGYL